MASVFTYGTLMFQTVWESVTGIKGMANSPGVPATVSGFARYRVTGESYPAAIRVADEQISGVVYHDVSDDILSILDSFEGSDYQRIEVPAQIADSSGGIGHTTVAANLYLCMALGTVDRQPWDAGAFEKNQLENFMRDYVTPFGARKPD